MRLTGIRLIAAIGLLLAPSLVRADTITFILNISVHTSGQLNPPNATGPWLEAIFNQIDSHTVSLVLEPLSGLAGSYVNGWGFNSSDPTSDLNFTASSSTIAANQIASMPIPDQFFQPTSDPNSPKFSFGFVFNDNSFTSSSNEPTFTIKSTTNSISAATFALATASTSPLYSEADIEASGNHTGVVYAAVEAPAPSAAAVLIVLLSGVGLWKSARSLRPA